MNRTNEQSGPSGLGRTEGSMGEMADRRGTEGFDKGAAECVTGANTFDTADGRERRESGQSTGSGGNDVGKNRY